MPLRHSAGISIEPNRVDVGVGEQTADEGFLVRADEDLTQVVTLEAPRSAGKEGEVTGIDGDRIAAGARSVATTCTATKHALRRLSTPRRTGLDTTNRYRTERLVSHPQPC